MRIIAFDLGSTMGWATNYRRPLVTGCRTFEGSRVERLAAIQQWLQNFTWNVDVVIYETPLVRGQDATRILWGIAALLEAAVTRAQLPILDVAVPTIKKFATGHGFSPKQKMLAAAKKFGYTGANEHEADAVCLLNYAIANLERGKQ
jgi:Holliday junction resolvasome RuvABC endonuclease subunit